MKCKNLQIGYTQILSNVGDLNFTASTVLLGKNGAGKSTFLKTLSGFIPPVSGSIEINGIDIKGMSSYDLAQKVAFLSTTLVRPNYMKVIDYLGLGLVQVDHSNAIIESLQLDPLLPYRLTNLSDGQLQKVRIAKLLMRNTPYLLLDEPLQHLDPWQRQLVVTTLADYIADKNATMIIASHELDLFQSFINRVLFISNEVKEIDFNQKDIIHHYQ